MIKYVWYFFDCTLIIILEIGGNCVCVEVLHEHQHFSQSLCGPPQLRNGRNCHRCSKIRCCSAGRCQSRFGNQRCRIQPCRVFAYSQWWHERVLLGPASKGSYFVHRYVPRRIGQEWSQSSPWADWCLLDAKALAAKMPKRCVKSLKRMPPETSDSMRKKWVSGRDSRLCVPIALAQEHLFFRFLSNAWSRQAQNPNMHEISLTNF